MMLPLVVVVVVFFGAGDDAGVLKRSRAQPQDVPLGSGTRNGGRGIGVGDREEIEASLSSLLAVKLPLFKSCVYGGRHGGRYG